MPHFCDGPGAEDPDTLRWLRTLLHGASPALRPLPTLEGRFGMTARQEGRAALVGFDRVPGPSPRRLRRPATT